jgi:diguanylate cyclase (GGDEF)-like protein
LRSFLIAIRYSATPFLVAQIIFTIIKRQRWYIFIPALILAIIDFVSIPTGIVFSIDETETMVRGPLGLLPYIVVGIYCALLVVLMIHNSSKQKIERVPIIYFCFAFFAGIVMPFIIGKEYALLFCTTIGISVFVYYVFMILQVTKKDPLTGLLNRQAFYADIADNPQEISALISIDMNGLKIINDSEGHTAGDTAISTIANCFRRAAKRNQMVYRIGGDEFVVLLQGKGYDTREETMRSLNDKIEGNISTDGVVISMGYSVLKPEDELLHDVVERADQMMYERKQELKRMGAKTRET